MFGADRATIQAAVQVLQSEGQVETRQGQGGGTFVVAPSNEVASRGPRPARSSGRAPRVPSVYRRDGRLHVHSWKRAYMRLGPWGGRCSASMVSMLMKALLILFEMSLISCRGGPQSQ